MVNKAYTRSVAANLISSNLVHAGNRRMSLINALDILMKSCRF